MKTLWSSLEQPASRGSSLSAPPRHLRGQEVTPRSDLKGPGKPTRPNITLLGDSVPKVPH